jgi:YidC/Oxa1 family membrane protein insertase
VDKKNTLIGTVLIAAAVVVLYFGQKNSRQPTPPYEVRKAVDQVAPAATPAQSAPGAAAQAPALAPNIASTAFVTAQADHDGAAVTVLENDFIQVRFTNFGGAIRDVAFKKYPAALGRPDPFIFNELHASPMLAFEGTPGLDRSVPFELVSQSAASVTYRAVLASQLEVVRTYTLSPDAVAATDPYQIRTETVLRNLGAKPSPAMRLALSLGTAAPSSLLDNGLELTTGYSTGDSQTFIRRSTLQGGSGFLGLGASDPKPFVASDGPIAWGTVKNRFFAAVLTPDEPAAGLVTRRVKLLEILPDEDPRGYGITGAMEFDVRALPAHGQVKLGGDFYVGPKEYHRLANADVFKKDQDRLMDYGWFRFFSAILLTLMTWMHSWTYNWGVSIILTTLTLKLVFLPFTLSASRTSKRMQSIQPELKALREKFKDNPQKQQAATMELFKKHKVNPMGGCLPVLFTMPFFFGFYRMLASAAELRFAPFLWARDLTAPDTVISLGHGTLPFLGTFNLNILPILLCATVFVQMRITPQPTVDSSQARMMKFMPILFMVFCYSYSCALSLYSTVNGLFTIAQQMVINRTRDPVPDPALATATGSGKPAKNVTPKKR